jgi:hypothetical protein
VRGKDGVQLLGVGRDGTLAPTADVNLGALCVASSRSLSPSPNAHLPNSQLTSAVPRA